MIRRIPSTASSHHDTHDYASSASPMVSNATLEMYSVEIERDGDDYDDIDDDDVMMM